MAILDFLPSFKVVEVNRSTGLVAGHVLAQFPLDDTFPGIETIGSENREYLENGFILGLGEDGVLAAFDSAVHGQPLLAYTEEITTIFDGNKWFATEQDDEGVIYPRAIGLFIGDSFTTDNYEFDGSLTWSDSDLYAIVEDGVLTITDAATSSNATPVFKVEQSTLPTGDDAAQFTYVGVKA